LAGSVKPTMSPNKTVSRRRSPPAKPAALVCEPRKAAMLGARTRARSRGDYVLLADSQAYVERIGNPTMRDIVLHSLAKRLIADYNQAIARRRAEAGH
jgi:hypothetical protein